MSRLLSFFRRTDGASSLEFVFLFPAFMLVLLSAIESGMLMMRGASLERGLNMAVRDVRLNIDTPQTEQELITRVCVYAAFIRDCGNVLRVELVRIDRANFNLPVTAATCVKRAEQFQPALDFVTTTDHDLMLVRVCASVSPYFPTTGLGLRLAKDGTGHYSLTASSAFVVEPT